MRSTAFLPPLLGAIGLLASGPLVATILIGRTGPIPSVRWAGLALAVWITAGALGSARRGPRGTAMWQRAASALESLALMAAAAPLLPLLYLDDESFHLVRASAAGVQVCLFVAALLALGFTVDVSGDQSTDRAMSDAPSTPTSSAPMRLARHPAVAAPLAGLVLMVGLNDLLFEPLGARGAHPGLWLANMAGLALAAWLLALGTGPLFALAVIVATAVAGSLQSQLATAPGGVILGTAAVILAALVRAGRSGAADAALLVAVACLSVAAVAWLKPSLASIGPAIPAVLAIGLIARPQLWQGVSGRDRARFGVPLGIGYVLACISPERLGLAAREAIAVLPGLARPATAGLLVIGVVLLLWPRTRAPQTAEAA